MERSYILFIDDNDFPTHERFLLSYFLIGDVIHVILTLQFPKFIASDRLWWQGLARILADKGFIREGGDMV